MRRSLLRVAQRAQREQAAAQSKGLFGVSQAARTVPRARVAREAAPAAVRGNAALPSVEQEPAHPFQAANVRVEVAEPSGYRNVDGERIDDGRYTRFKAEVANIVPEERIITDLVRKFAYGTDASFYRLVPQVIVKVASEREVQRILPLALKHGTPVTFRAAGTSLSGQVIFPAYDQGHACLWTGSLSAGRCIRPWRH